MKHIRNDNNIYIKLWRKRHGRTNTHTHTHTDEHAKTDICVFNYLIYGAIFNETSSKHLLAYI